MNTTTRFQEDAIQAVDQLVEILNTKNAEQIAKIEVTLLNLGLLKLSSIANLAGQYNAGEDYQAEMVKAMQQLYS